MAQIIKQTFKEYLSFLKNPTDDSDPDHSIGYKFKMIGIFFLIEFPVVLFFVLMVSILEHFNLLDIGNNKLEALFSKYSYIGLIFAIALITPFSEEIIFRLPLNYRRNYLLRLVVYCISVTGLINDEKLDEAVQKYWKASFKYFFYFLTLAFGFMHLTNYENTKDLILLFPLLTITQIVGGSIMGFLRIKYGFIWGFYYHAIFNLVFLTLAYNH